MSDNIEALRTMAQADRDSTNRTVSGKLVLATIVNFLSSDENKRNVEHVYLNINPEASFSAIKNGFKTQIKKAKLTELVWVLNMADDEDMSEHVTLIRLIDKPENEADVEDNTDDNDDDDEVGVEVEQ